MKFSNKIRKKLSNKRKGQVFILATLVIVVYSVSMIAVVTELSIDRTKTDQIDLPHMVSEYLSEMNYQLQLQLYNYIENTSFNQNDIILGLQSFLNAFTLYATTKGVGATITLRLNEFSFNAKKASAITAIGSLPYNTTTYLSINSTILFQSSNSGSKISGIFNHYYGINLLVTTTNNNILTITQRDSQNNVLEFISGASFTLPAGMINNNNGKYTHTGTLNGLSLNLKLPSGLQLVS